MEDASVPSFFECAAEHFFVQSLNPAFSYVLSVASSRFEVAQRLASYEDELFFGVLGAVNWHFLSFYNASFSENFYSLHRVSNGQSPDLTGRQRLLSMLFTVGLPYTRSKLEKWFEQYRMQALEVQGEEQSEAFRNLVREGPVWKRLCVKSYPWMCGLLDGSSFLFQLLYLHRRTVWFSLYLRLANVRLARLLQEDLIAHEKVSILSRARFLKRFESWFVWRALSKTMFAGMDVLQYVLPIGVFVYRFAEWWNSPDNEALRGPKRITKIPPPPEMGIASLELPRDVRICPVCRLPRNNAAASPSGFVCCYVCLFVHVRDHGVDPVSGMACKVEQIVKLYE